MFAACSVPYTYNKALKSEIGSRADSNAIFKKAVTLDVMTGIVVVAFALLSPYLGIKLSSEAFYLTLGIGATYAVASLVDLIVRSLYATESNKRILTNSALLIGISTLALGILGMKLGFLSSDLSYALVGIGSASSLYAVMSDLTLYGRHRLMRQAGMAMYQGPYYPFGLCKPKYEPLKSEPLIDA